MTTQSQIDRRPGPTTPRRRCTATCADGSSCRAWAVHGSDPARCAAHGGGRAPVGAPPGNQNARVHGFYATSDRARDPDFSACTIDVIIDDLYRKQQRLSDYIDEHMDDLSPPDLARFLRIHAQSCSRLGRLLRDREALSGGADAIMSGAIGRALDELSEEWGVDLS